jgi:hypothetical protein
MCVTTIERLLNIFRRAGESFQDECGGCYSFKKKATCWWNISREVVHKRTTRNRGGVVNEGVHCCFSTTVLLMLGFYRGETDCINSAQIPSATETREMCAMPLSADKALNDGHYFNAEQGHHRKALSASPGTRVRCSSSYCPTISI